MDLRAHDWFVWPAAGSDLVIPDATAKQAQSEDTRSPMERVSSYALSCQKIAAAEPTPSQIHLDRPVTIDNIWRHPDAHAAALLLLILKRYGDESLEWEPETLKLTLNKDGIELSNSAWTKILAGRVAMEAPGPWKQWDVFHWTCRGLAGLSPNFSLIEIPELGHLVAGYEFMRGVDSAMETTYDVDKFIAACAKSNGLPYLPPPLDFAQDELENIRIRCEECEAIHRDHNDVRCVTCGSSRLKKLPYEYASIRDRVRDRFNKISTLSLEKALDLLGDNEVDTATYTLALHWGYAHTQRILLQHQVRMIQ